MNWAARVTFFVGLSLFYLVAISLFTTSWGLVVPLAEGLRAPAEYPYGGYLGVSEYAFRLLLGIGPIAWFVLYVPWSRGRFPRTAVAAVAGVTIYGLFLVLALPEPWEVDRHTAAQLLEGNPEGATAPGALLVDTLAIELVPGLPRQIPGHLTISIQHEPGLFLDDFDEPGWISWPQGTEHYSLAWYHLFDVVPEGPYRRTVEIEFFKVASQEQAAAGSVCTSDWRWAGWLDSTECRSEVVSGVPGTLLDVDVSGPRGSRILFFMYAYGDCVVHMSVRNERVALDAEMPEEARRKDLRPALESVVGLVRQRSLKTMTEPDCMPVTGHRVVEQKG